MYKLYNNTSADFNKALDKNDIKLPFVELVKCAQAVDVTIAKARVKKQPV